MYPCKIEAVALFDSTRELNMLFLSDLEIAASSVMC